MNFPQTVLNTIVEIFVNGTWYDITAYVYQRDPINIGYGRPNEASGMQPATLTLTLNNRDGSFSTRNTSGQFYPYLGRNTQLRVSVNDTSASSVTYNGYRFWGEVPEWPTEWDISGTDIFSQITAAGCLRRISLGKNLGSALRRYYMLKSVTDATYPIAYWPCEEGINSTQLSNLIVSADPLVISGPTAPTLASNSDFHGSDPIPLVNGSTWTGSTGSYSQSGPVTWSTPGTYWWTCPGSVTSLSTVETWGGGGGGMNGYQNNGHGGAAGGGGEYAKDTTVAVTPGKNYQVVVGAGGQGGHLSSNGSVENNGVAGANSSFTADSVTTTAHGGSPGTYVAYPGGKGAGGTGSASATHFNGGTGGQCNTSGSYGGSGGGGSGGSAANGNNGTNGGTSNSGAAGGAAVTGGAAGGNGGSGGPHVDKGGGIAPAPGGGGGSGGENSSNTAAHSGGNGGAGQVKINFSSSNTPNNVVLRFLLEVPKQGTVDSTVVMRATISSGTFTSVECYYKTANNGSLGFRGFNGVTLEFDTGNSTITNVNGAIPLMVSMEMAVSGSAVAYSLGAMEAGTATVTYATGSLAASTIGACSQVVVSPAGALQDVCVGHIVLQYAFENMIGIAGSLNGHNGECGAKRFQRLCREEGVTATLMVSEGVDHFGFESGLQGWTAVTNCTITQDSTTNVGPPIWPSEGTHSLKIVPTTNAAFQASSPTGLSGIPCSPNDIITTTTDVTTNTLGTMTITGFYTQIWFYNSAGTLISSPAGIGITQSGYQILEMGGFGQAPAGAAFFSIQVGGTGFTGSSPAVFIDNVSISPAMGYQTDSRLFDLLTQIEQASAGQISDARSYFGLVYRTRINMMKQSPVVVLNYSQNTIAQPGLRPVTDEQLIRNDLSISRINGGTIVVAQQTGPLSVQASPNGVGDYPYTYNLSLAYDIQLINVGAWYLSLGTVDQPRYPAIPLELARSQLAGSGLFDKIPGLNVGDYVEITNPPPRVPDSPTKQLVWGYAEVIRQFTWTMTLNGVPETPYEAANYNWW